MMSLDNIIIFSLDKTDKPASDEQRAAIVALFDAKPCLGLYKGQVENSFLVDFRHYSAIFEIAKAFNQECILVVSDGARLVYLDQFKVEHIGRELIPVDSMTGLDSYTLIDGVTYVIR